MKKIETDTYVHLLLEYVQAKWEDFRSFAGSYGHIILDEEQVEDAEAELKRQHNLD